MLLESKKGVSLPTIMVSEIPQASYSNIDIVARYLLRDLHHCYGPRE